MEVRKNTHAKDRFPTPLSLAQISSIHNEKNVRFTLGTKDKR
jgi:hypothetical protein